MIKLLGIAIVIVLLFGAALIGFGIFKLPVKTLTAQIDSADEIISKTYDADNAIANYEWFKQQIEDIKATERKLENMHAELDSYSDYGAKANWSFDTKRAYNSLNSKTTGMDNFYEEQIGDYNARMNMENRNLYKDKLPLSVERILW